MASGSGLCEAWNVVRGQKNQRVHEGQEALRVHERAGGPEGA